ncbi:hypothetical protein MBLNU13_g02208t2 [Cladosporium sp. NU13]
MSPLGTPSPPPPCALHLLARAHILLRTREDLCTQIKYGAIAVCGIMVYGTGMWQLAQKNAVSLLHEEEDEDGMVLVDFEDGRGANSDRDVDCVDDEDGCFGTTAADETGLLVERASAEIKKWDRETGKRVGAVLNELQVLV